MCYVAPGETTYGQRVTLSVFTRPVVLSRPEEAPGQRMYIVSHEAYRYPNGSSLMVLEPHWSS